MNINDHHLSDRDEDHVRLISQAQRRVHALILTLVYRLIDAEDILQETNLVLWRKRDSYRPGTDFYAWAFEIARLQVLAHRARQARHGEPIDAALLAEVAQAAQAESESYDRRNSALRDCLQKLAPSQRDLIVRRYQPQESVNKMAMELGKSAKAVSESLRRVRDVLRSCIERTLIAEQRQ